MLLLALQAFDPKYEIIISVSNVIGSITFGKRFDYDDPVFVSYISRIRDVLDNVGTTAVVSTFPVLRYIPGDPFHCQSTLDNMHFIESDFIKPVLKGHMEAYSQNEPAADFIDAYIKEIKRAEAEGKPTTLNGLSMFSYTCVSVCMSLCKSPCMCVCTCMFLFSCFCACICMCICQCVLCERVCERTCLCASSFVYVSVCVCACGSEFGLRSHILRH